MGVRAVLLGAFWALTVSISGSTALPTEDDTMARICEDSSPSKNLTAVRGPCPAGSTATRIAGANIFDSLWVTSTGMETCCNATGGPAVFADAVAALEDAASNGIRVFRFFASLFGPAGKMWVENPGEYWRQFDALMDTVEQNGLYCIPSIGYGKLWAQVANAVTAGLNESTNDVIINTTSISWGLNAKYFDEIVRRYGQRRAVLFWELGNELNLGVNLGPEWCGGEQCYNTAQMVSYTERLVGIIKAADGVRPISSGYSAGRGSEWHQEHCPAGQPHSSGACSGGYWGLDTEEQWLEMFEKQNAAVDIMSIHHYDDDKSCWFNKSFCGMTNVGLVTLAARRAKLLGKTIYVGEYGGPGPNFTGPSLSDQAFPAAMLDLQVQAGASDSGADGSFMLSTIWAFESPSHRKDMTEIWPGSTRPKEQGSARMLRLIAAANKKMAAQAGIV